MWDIIHYYYYSEILEIYIYYIKVNNDGDITVYVQ